MHPQILYFKVVVALFLRVSSAISFEVDDLLMLAFSIWCKLLPLGDDESLMHQAPPKGNVDDAVRWPTFLRSLAMAVPSSLPSLAMAAPLVDLFLL